MTGKGSRRKGARVENEIVRMHADVCHAEKVSRTGYTGHDVEVAGQFKAEVKSRKSGEGFKTLDAWLGENDLLFLRRNRQRPIVVMPWAMYARLMRAHEKAEAHRAEADTYAEALGAKVWVGIETPAPEEPADE